MSGLDSMQPDADLKIRSGDLEVLVPRTFRWFDPTKPVRVYTRNLPHWRQEGATYFVTFRLADSVPHVIWLDMQREARDWVARIKLAERHNHGILPGPVQEQWEIFQKRHASRLESILDTCRGSCVLRDPESRQIVADALRRFDGERYHLEGFVIMPNHVHLAVTPLPGHEVEDTIRSWKTFSARVINQHQGNTGTLWQAESYDRIVRDADHFVQVMRYITNNPRKAGLPTASYTWESKCTTRITATEPSQVLAEEPSEHGDHGLVW